MIHKCQICFFFIICYRTEHTSTPSQDIALNFLRLLWKIYKICASVCICNVYSVCMRVFLTHFVKCNKAFLGNFTFTSIINLKKYVRWIRIESNVCCRRWPGFISRRLRCRVSQLWHTTTAQTYFSKVYTHIHHVSSTERQYFCVQKLNEMPSIVLEIRNITCVHIPLRLRIVFIKSVSFRFTYS